MLCGLIEYTLRRFWVIMKSIYDKAYPEPERFDAAEWTGQNILGFALMEVRKMLQNS